MPAGRPISEIYSGLALYCDSKDGVMNNLSCPSVNAKILFLLKLMLKLEDQEKFFFLILSKNSVISNPSLRTLPMFFMAELNPVEVGNSAFNNRSRVFFL